MNPTTCLVGRGVGVVFAAVLGAGVRADVRLPAVFSSGMVVQQASDNVAWGWADPGERVELSASWMGAPAVATAGKDGRWIISFRAPPAAEVKGAQKITVKGKNSVEISDVLVGEV